MMRPTGLASRTALTMAGAVALLTYGALSAHAQTTEPDEWSQPRTAWGAPDIQGIWDYQSQTPLERPAGLAARASFSEEEAAQVRQQALERNSVDRRDGGAERDLARAYGEIWYIRNPVPNTRTSLVIDPSDGRIPPLTPEAERRREARQEYVRTENPTDSAPHRLGCAGHPGHLGLSKPDPAGTTGWARRPGIVL